MKTKVNKIISKAFYIAAEHYAKEKKIDKTGDWRLYHKAWVLLIGALALYLVLLNVSMPAYLSLMLCAILGFVMASIGFNVMHDACHGSFSKNETLNTIMGYTLNILGGNSYIWKQKHNIIHHTYTNVDGVDDDMMMQIIHYVFIV